MKKVQIGILCSAAAMVIAAPAFAASDYFLKIDGVDGEAKAKVTVRGWDPVKKESIAGDVDTDQAGAAARDTSPKVTASQNTQSLRESSGRKGCVKLTASQNSQSLRESRPKPHISPSQNSQSLKAAPTGDLDGDGAQDIGAFEQADAISGMSIALPVDSEAARKWCRELHVKTAHLVKADGVVYDLEDAAVSSCSTDGSVTTIVLANGKIREKSGHVTLIK